MKKLFALVALLFSINQFEISGYPKIIYIDPSNLIDHDDPLEGLIKYLEAAKNNTTDKQAALAHAIIERDVDKVSKCMTDIDITQTRFATLLLYKDLNDLKELAKIDRNERQNFEFLKKALKTGSLIHDTYLSLAILNSTFDETDIDKQNSFKIIELLLQNKAYPQNPETEPWIQSVGKVKTPTSKQDDLPCIIAQPLIFRCVDLGCRSEIFDLLFTHGAKVHSSIRTDGTTLGKYITEEKSIELLPILKKWLNFDDFVSLCHAKTPLSTWLPFLKTVNSENKWICYEILCDLLQHHRKFTNAHAKLFWEETFSTEVRDCIVHKIEGVSSYLNISLELTQKADQPVKFQDGDLNSMDKTVKEEAIKLGHDLAHKYEFFFEQNPKLKHLLNAYCESSGCELNCVITWAPKIEYLSQKIKINLH